MGSLAKGDQYLLSTHQLNRLGFVDIHINPTVL
jgi:hypothetical protein